jgi:hypothetical protein
VFPRLHQREGKLLNVVRHVCLNTALSLSKINTANLAVLIVTGVASKSEELFSNPEENLEFHSAACHQHRLRSSQSIGFLQTKNTNLDLYQAAPFVGPARGGAAKCDATCILNHTTYTVVSSASKTRLTKAPFLVPAAGKRHACFHWQPVKRLDFYLGSALQNRICLQEPILIEKYPASGLVNYAQRVVWVDPENLVQQKRALYNSWSVSRVE